MWDPLETESKTREEFRICSRSAGFSTDGARFIVVVVVIVVRCLSNSGLAHSGCLTNAGWRDRRRGKQMCGCVNE